MLVASVPRAREWELKFSAENIDASSPVDASSTSLCTTNQDVTVSELITTGSGAATLEWSQSLNGTARLPGQMLNLPSSSQVNAPANIGLILGEATYAHAPISATSGP
jgi:hypothetical protein